MFKQFLTAIIVVAVLGVGYWWWQGQNTGSNETVSESEMMENDSSVQGAIEDGAMMEDGMINDTGASAPMSAAVSYNGASFSPAKVTIKRGGTVTWTNDGETSMWVASAQHPTHAVYAGTNLQQHCATEANDSFDQCRGGDVYSFTFDKVGTWNFHDHLHTNVFGSVEVVE